MKVSREGDGDGNTYIKKQESPWDIRGSNGQLFDLYLMHVLSSEVQLKYVSGVVPFLPNPSRVPR